MPLYKLGKLARFAQRCILQQLGCGFGESLFALLLELVPSQPDAVNTSPTPARLQGLCVGLRQD